MKQQLFLVALGLVMGFGCLAQKEENDGKKVTAPPAATAAFHKTFPGSSHITWKREDANYEADFTQNGKKMSAGFDNMGTLLETEVTIRVSELPAPVLQYIQEHYKGASIREAAKITRPNGEITYEAEVNKVDVLFDVNGKFIKEEKD